MAQNKQQDKQKRWNPQGLSKKQIKLYQEKLQELNLYDGRIDGIWQDIKDTSGLKKDCQIGKSLGYVGKSVIYPDQIKTVHKIFHPNKTEIAWAKKVCNIYKKSSKKGKGATVIEGKMIDEVHYKRAKALLEISK